MVKIREIFSSIQGEGPYIGYKQLFIRFCNCNLHCKYCDTEFEMVNAKDYSIDEFVEIVNQNKDCHSISLTGGEPLLSLEFLKTFLPQCPLPVYLETNGTLYENLEGIIENIDYVSADIKLPSCTGLKPLWDEHNKFFKIASKKILFAKMVFDNSITQDEIEKACKLCKKYNVELILQPMMRGKVSAITSKFMEDILNKCLNIYPKIRLIPQVHKFLDVQ